MKLNRRKNILDKKNTQKMLLIYLILISLEIFIRIQYKTIFMFILSTSIISIFIFGMSIIAKVKIHFRCIAIVLWYFLPQVIFGIIVKMLGQFFMNFLVNKSIVIIVFIISFFLIAYSFAIVYKGTLHYYNLAMKKNIIVLLPVIIYVLISEVVLVSMIINKFESAL